MAQIVPGPELDRDVESQVFGNPAVEDVPPYSTDDDASNRIAEFVKRDLRWRYREDPLSENAYGLSAWKVQIDVPTGHPGNSLPIECVSRSLPLARCGAALKAFRSYPPDR